MQSSKEQQGDRKDFLSYQCEEIEESNRIGKTRDLLKKRLDLEKAEEPQIILPTSVGLSKK